MMQLQLPPPDQDLVDRIKAEAGTLPSIETLKEYVKAIDTEIEYLLNSNIDDKIICYISRVKPGKCEKCELCPLFVFEEEKKNSPHPCWHIDYFDGSGMRLWDWIKAREEGKISELQYRAAFRYFMVPQFRVMKMLVEALILNLETAKETGNA